MATMTHPPRTPHSVIGGVDTHADTHTAAVITEHGVLVGVEQFPTTVAGYTALKEWMLAFGPVLRVGVEGTGAYGAGLTRSLRGAAIEVIEVDRPDRAARRRAGKSDPIDAENAARAVLSGRAAGTPKDRDGKIEALRVLRITRNGAIKHRSDTMRRIKSLLITAPDPIRDRFRNLTDRVLLTTVAALRPDPAAAAAGDITAATTLALRTLAREHRALTEQISDLDQLITPLVTAINPALMAVPGVGADVAGTLLITAGDNPERLRSDATFAMLCGAAPLPASSGRTLRHRLNRGGNRDANSALWRIAITRMSHEPRTRDYVARRTREGLTKPEIIRCLKRHIARELHPILTT